MDRVKVLLLLGWIVACSAMSSRFLDNEWDTWKAKYGKNYTTPEQEKIRRGNWEASRKKVLEHNQLADQGKKTYRLEMNHFADMSSEERRSRSCLLPTQPKGPKPPVYRGKPSLNIPEEVDWRKENCVNPVRNQGSYCGSCWAFATVAAIESRYCIKYKELVKLSEQQLVDCDQGGDQGCCGGLPKYALRYISEHGLMLRKDYEYKERNNECRYESGEILKMNMSKYYVLPDEQNMAVAVALEGPVTVGIASHEDFQMFDGKGVYDGQCEESTNHAIVIVGYGTEDGQDYWIIRNSWGEEWADGGYAKFLRNENHCFIGEEVSTADILGPKEIPQW
uniref:Cathepsin L1-like n=1 Tax=Geotrypetes seraphini TaxID=260995 RepID=A0A6P8NKD0_GEOSA|nr:cathepsin L1-like [Geotrypetes seraphini]XP_033776469.1 cathepsin L1-like [Geotrypetes seraphini]XP_033776471.1 cathepsin L1-like [Geotrypetes seraphini]XP_033776472.1 cathepsin L1-like [Geotrypetes seraphini]